MCIIGNSGEKVKGFLHGLTPIFSLSVVRDVFNPFHAQVMRRNCLEWWFVIAPLWLLLVLPLVFYTCVMMFVGISLLMAMPAILIAAVCEHIETTRRSKRFTA